MKLNQMRAFRHDHGGKTPDQVAKAAERFARACYDYRITIEQAEAALRDGNHVPYIPPHRGREIGAALRHV